MPVLSGCCASEPLFPEFSGCCVSVLPFSAFPDSEVFSPVSSGISISGSSVSVCSFSELSAGSEEFDLESREVSDVMPEEESDASSTVEEVLDLSLFPEPLQPEQPEKAADRRHSTRRNIENA